MRIERGHQPAGRWPDFYVFDPDLAANRPTLRISVRMARTKKSDLIPQTRRRLRRKWPETPLDDRASRMIVFPRTSLTKPEDDPEIPALKRDAFFTWIDAGWVAAPRPEDQAQE